ncbi:MAG TPA: hypothetical protein VFM21_04170, partial [Terriglobia bacterium]|nr:hypothetical protein [Terriglobia bacterium]
HLILGGKDKGAPYAPLKPLLQGRVREILLIGAASDRIESELRDVAVMVRAGDLETAVHRAFQNAVAGETVLLAPACASFDQFEDYEHRGRVFKKIVSEIARNIEGTPAGARIQAPPPRVSEAEVAKILEPQPAPPPKLEELPEVAAPVACQPEMKVEPPAPASHPEPVEPAGRELTYIYEVGAEDHPADDSDSAAGIGEEGFEPLDAKDLGKVEDAEDESMVFEVPASARERASSPSEKANARLTSGNGKLEKQG